MIESNLCSRRQALGALAIGLPAALTLRGTVSGAVTRVATVIFIRHAEKAQGEGASKDPSLTAAGMQRATKLAQTLQAAGVTRVFATEFKRTQETASPMADAFGLEIEEYAAGRSQVHADSLAALDPGAVAVVVGHSNTVPAMVEALGGKLKDLDPKGHLFETEYDRVIVQVLFAPEEGEPMRAIQTLDLRIEM